jgi:diguanylate cyclase (GGDEF)-like protein
VERQNLIQDLVAITGEYAPNRLAVRLADAIRNNLPIQQLDIIEFHLTVDSSAEEIAAIPVHDLLQPNAAARRVADIPGLAALVARPSPDAVETAQGTLLVPVMHVADLVGAVVLHDATLDHNARFALLAMVRVFSNQLFLLRRNERDGLTGLLNRAAFDARLARTLQRMTFHRRNHEGEGAPTCLALLDIDHFKRINDRFGHLIGDEVLLHLSQLMTASFRHYDQLFRYGGEEFALLLYDVDLVNARTILDRFRTTVAAYRFPQAGGCSVSIGVAGLTPNTLPPVIVDKADRALYYAKNNGRNQVHGFEDLVAAGKVAPAPADGGVELF